MLVDNLKHVKMMEEAGFDENQSKAIIGVWSNIVELDLVTNKDLKIALLEFEKKLDSLEGRLLAKLAVFQLGYLGLIIAIIKGGLL